MTQISLIVDIRRIRELRGFLLKAPRDDALDSRLQSDWLGGAVDVFGGGADAVAVGFVGICGLGRGASSSSRAGRGAERGDLCLWHAQRCGVCGGQYGRGVRTVPDRLDRVQ